MSYYTTYRPQTIEALDLVAVRNALKTILTSGKFSHAYLFTGPKGTGKTSSARILAKVLNCEKNREQGTGDRGQLQEPCNECDSCRRITNGSSLACIEMDAASNRGIDDIRTLKERIGLAPAEGRYTVYIIDEVHMLTTEAFNALLKTLEEPPAHAVFILCTTDPQKIPDTVISRCTRVLFQKAGVAEVVSSLSKAVKGEHLAVDEGVLEAIAARVDGSFRDGMKTLEQAALTGKKITVDLIDEMTGYGDDYEVATLIRCLLQKDGVGALTALQTKLARGVDIGVFARRLVEEVRRQMLEGLMNGKSDRKLIDLAGQVSEATVKVKQAVIPVLPLELLIASWCDGTGEVKKENKREEHHVQKEVAVTSKAKEVVVEKETYNPPENPFVGTATEVVNKWQEILAAVKPLNHSLEALLRSARPTVVENGWLTIEAYYKFHKEQLEQDRYRKQLESAMGSVLGGAVCLKFVLGQTLKKSEKSEPLSPQDEALAQAAEEVFGK